MKNDINKDTINFVGISFCAILLLSSALVLSPWAYQFDDDVFGECIDQESELAEITATIESISSTLPSFSYMDRFYSKEKREQFRVARSEIYELQWKRIQLLQENKQHEALKEALEEYIKVVGHYQTDAKRMLNLVCTNPN